MSISIRQADLSKDREKLINFLRENLTPFSNANLFEWRYCNNPDGMAQAWVAFNETRQAVIGVAGAFPRLMRVCGKDVICWNLGDFAIESGFRSLGPALQLQRACLTPIGEGRIPFCYDHPNRRMMAIYERMGIGTCGRIIRFAKPLKVNRKMKEIVKPELVARGLSALGNTFLALKDHAPRYNRGYNVNFLEGRFGQEFSELDERISGSLRVYGRRTAEYLNWRYLENPLHRYEIATVRHGGELLAYAILLQNNGDAMLVDLFGVQESNITHVLLREIIKKVRQQGVLTLSVPLSESSPLVPSLQQAGFYGRETSPFIVYAQGKSDLKEIVTTGNNWFLTHGDRDI